MDWLTTPSVHIMVAPPGRGKTTLIKYIVKHCLSKGMFDYGIVYNPSSFNGDYDYIRRKYPNAVRSEYTTEHLESIRNQQRSFINNPQIGSDNCPSCFIILDDCLGETPFKSAQFTQLITTYRHYKLTIFIASQVLMEIPPTVRACLSMLHIFRPNDEKTYEDLWQQFTKGVKELRGKTKKESIEKWRDFLDSKTNEKGKCLSYRVNMDADLDNTVKNRFLQIKAPIVKDFDVEFLPPKIIEK